MNLAETVAKKLFRKLGLEVKWYNIYSSDSLNLINLLRYHRINVLLDIGANVGDYAIELQGLGFNGRIISFEPQSEAHRILTSKHKRSNKKWLIADRMALGNYDGNIELNIAANSLSSSILPMLEKHITAAKDSRYISKEVAPIRRLDSIAGQFELSGNIFMKIDVQGYEMEVLKGASTTLQHTVGLQIELSLADLYQNQTDMMDMIHFMKEHHFYLYGLFPMFKDEESGRLLQADGVFFKE